MPFVYRTLALTLLPPLLTRVAVAGEVTKHKPIDIRGLEIFYREAGPKGAPTILLLHGNRELSAWRSRPTHTCDLA
jgi:hypothetical protein